MTDFSVYDAIVMAPSIPETKSSEKDTSLSKTKQGDAPIDGKTNIPIDEKENNKEKGIVTFQNALAGEVKNTEDENKVTEEDSIKQETVESLNAKTNTGAKKESHHPTPFFVKGFPWWMKDVELEKMASEHGEVLELIIDFDRSTGKSFGRAQITMQSAQQAKSSVQALCNRKVSNDMILFASLTPIPGMKISPLSSAYGPKGIMKSAEIIRSRGNTKVGNVPNIMPPNIGNHPMVVKMNMRGMRNAPQPWRSNRGGGMHRNPIPPVPFRGPNTFMGNMNYPMGQQPPPHAVVPNNNMMMNIKDNKDHTNNFDYRDVHSKANSSQDRRNLNRAENHADRYRNESKDAYDKKRSNSYSPPLSGNYARKDRGYEYSSYESHRKRKSPESSREKYASSKRDYQSSRTERRVNSRRSRSSSSRDDRISDRYEDRRESRYTSHRDRSSSKRRR